MGVSVLHTLLDSIGKPIDLLLINDKTKASVRSIILKMAGVLQAVRVDKSGVLLEFQNEDDNLNVRISKTGSGCYIQGVGIDWGELRDIRWGVVGCGKTTASCKVRDILKL